MNSNKEQLMLFIIVVLLLGYLGTNWAATQEVKEYKKAYAECVSTISAFNQGYTDVWNRDYNFTLGDKYGNISKSIENMS